MIALKKFPISRQLDQFDCGPTCLKMIAKYYGRHYSLQTLRDYTNITKVGVNLQGISEAASKIGFRTVGCKISFEQLDEEATLPCILYWNQNHFVVLPPQNYNRRKKKDKILIADPAHGLVKVNKEIFLKSWMGGQNQTGVALLLEPTPEFSNYKEERNQKRNLQFFLKYLTPYNKYIVQLFLGMLLASVLSLITPFLTQSLVDYGINQNNLRFIYLVLISQLALFLGTIAIDIIRSWLLLHMSARINISIISDFLVKLMKLPIRFFDTKMIGDIIQRVNDHSRIEQFLTSTSLSTIFSLVNLIIFSIVLAIYSIPVLSIFVVGSFLSIVWIIFFLKKRKELDYARFQRMSDNQNNILEIITGMQEIKMNNGETTYRWEWERTQAKLFKINTQGLNLEQLQMIGSSFFTQLKNIFITFFSAKEVLNGNITLGAMLSISYMVGQMNSPIEQLLSFFKRAQDAIISLDRLNEIHLRKDEEKEGELKLDKEIEFIIGVDEGESRGISLENVFFRYSGNSSPLVINGINLTIPFGKVTAIVGESGSGKTTLLKLLSKFYEPVDGNIYLNSIPFNVLSTRWWRDQCGVVMAEGYIFSNTIARNISVEEEIDQKRLLNAIKIANLESFIKDLPLGLTTKIGNSGNGISSGQRQRILIARAVYKLPKFIFLDEATSTLDANNEKTIVDNLQKFFNERTVVVIAHRLSTVKDADQIVVMEHGKIVEIGNHKSLSETKGKYYQLVKNQLELGT